MKWFCSTFQDVEYIALNAVLSTAVLYSPLNDSEYKCSAGLKEKKSVGFSWFVM